MDLRLPVRDGTLVHKIRKIAPHIHLDMYTFQSNSPVVQQLLRGLIEVQHHPEIQPLSGTERELASIEICGWDSCVLGHDNVQFHTGYQHLRKTCFLSLKNQAAGLSQLPMKPHSVTTQETTVLRRQSTKYYI